MWTRLALCALGLRVWASDARPIWTQPAPTKPDEQAQAIAEIDAFLAGGGDINEADGFRGTRLERAAEAGQARRVAHLIGIGRRRGGNTA